MWKDFFYFTKAQQAGVVALSLIIVLLLIVNFSLPHIHTKEESITNDTLFIRETQIFKQRLISKDSLLKAEQERLYAERKARYRTRRTETASASYTLFPFNPNTADSMTLNQLGISPRVASNIIKYRSKGGNFKSPDDLKKIYGLSQEKFDELKPYINISTPTADSLTNEHAQVQPLTAIANDTVANLSIELNTADSCQLTQLKGIGPYYAREIIRYRNQLGGFTHVEQLLEIPHMREDNFNQIVSHCTVDTTKIRRINVNKASVDYLKRHPYINFYQARVIYEFRRAKGQLDGMQDLRRFDEFTEQDIQKLTPYLDFE